jgi:hypothetical protein
VAEVNLDFMARCYLRDSFLASPVFIDIRAISAAIRCRTGLSAT